MTPERARELLESFPHCRILVVGDLMLDRYVRGRVDRISPEAPVPVVRVEEEWSVPGGACNVGLNIQALGGRAVMCGLAGCDDKADELLDRLREAGMDVSPVVRDASFTTIVKTRVVSDRQQMLRVDREGVPTPDHPFEARLSGVVSAAMKERNGVVLEDYGKGALTPGVTRTAVDAARAAGIPVGYDPKDNHELDVRGITFATPNRKEAFHMAGVRDVDPGRAPLQDPDLRRAGERLVDTWEADHVLVTLGPQGMLLMEPGREPAHISTRAREVFDVSGAGDTVIAVTMMSLVSGASFAEAAELANIAAGRVVAKLGTATTTAEEILESLEEGA